MPATSLDLSQIKTDALASASAFRSLIGLGTLATQSATITDYLTIASAASTYQPLDSDLTSIAALSTTAFGRGLLTEASATTARSTLGLGTLATQSPTGTPSASTFLRGDYSWQTIDLSGYLPLAGGTMTGQLTITQGTANTSVLTSTGYSLTGSNAQSLIDVAGTWNTTGTPTAFKLNVTDTASNAASLLMDLQVGGSSRFRVSKSGAITGQSIQTTSTQTLVALGSVLPNQDPGIAFIGKTNSGIGANSQNLAFYESGKVALNLTDTLKEFRVPADYVFAFSASTLNNSASDAAIARDASDILAQRRSINPQTFRLYGTFTDVNNYERAKIEWSSNVLRIGTEKAGTGSARALELQTDGVTRLTIGTDGVVTRSVATASNIGMILRSSDGGTAQPLLEFQNSSGAMLHRITTSVATFSNLVVTTGVTLIMCNVGSTGYYQFGTRSIIYAPANAQFSLRNLADTSGATLDAATDGTLAIKNRLGTSDGNITAAAATFSGNVTVSAVNLVTDTTTGTKIGTATTQKLGFFNATPVVQPTAVADATDAASVITQLNALLSRMRNLGLIAT